jgi:hypothetical protein
VYKTCGKIYTKNCTQKIRHNIKGKVVSKLTVLLLAHSGRVGPLRVTSRNPNEVTTPNRYLRDFFSCNLAVLWCQTEESKQRLCVQRHAKPLAPTSIVKQLASQPFDLASSTRPAYFSCFLAFHRRMFSSNGEVSSTNTTFFLPGL